MIDKFGHSLTQLTANARWLIWLVLITLMALVGLQQWQSGAKIQSDILAMLPKVDEDPLTERAIEQVESQLGNRVYLALIADSKELAITAAKQLMRSLQQHGQHVFTDIKSADIAQGETLSNFYFQHRFHLLTPIQKKRLANGQWQKLTEQAQHKLYNAFGYANSALLAHDPLLLYPDNLLALAPQRSLTAAQGVLLAPVPNELQVDKTQFAAIVMAKGTQSAFNPNAQRQQLTALATALNHVLQQTPSLQILRAGALFHAAAATQSAKGEVSSIGLISLIGVIALVWLAFRSVIPLAIALLTIATSLLFAIVSTLLFFGELHLLTLVFGTSLIGISIDYCFHFYCERLYRPAQTAAQIIKHILPAISLALITSVAAYASIGLAPFPGMQQVAIFCAAGLVGAYLTLILAYPKLACAPLPGANKPLALADRYQQFMIGRVNSHHKLSLAIAVAVLLPSTSLGLLKLTSDDDIRQLQHTPADIMTEENSLRRLLSGGTDNQFVLVRGGSEESLRQRLEALEPLLDSARQAQLIGNSLSLSHFLPSRQQQAANYRLQADIYLNHLDEIVESLGLNDALKPALVERFNLAESRYIRADDFLSSEAGAAFRPLWLSPTPNGEYGAIVLLGGISDVAQLSQLITAVPKVKLVDKVADISRVMGHYRQLTLWLLAIALVVAAVIFTNRFGLRLAAVIVAVPALAALFTLAALGLSGSALTLFHALALILVFGIGVDYSLFFAEAKQDSAGVMLAVCMSAGSTLLAFGLLAFSQTPAIHAFGLTLLLGIAFTFLLSPFIQIATRKTQ